MLASNLAEQAGQEPQAEQEEQAEQTENNQFTIAKPLFKRVAAAAAAAAVGFGRRRTDGTAAAAAAASAGFGRSRGICNRRVAHGHEQPHQQSSLTLFLGKQSIFIAVINRHDPAIGTLNQRHLRW